MNGKIHAELFKILFVYIYQQIKLTMFSCERDWKKEKYFEL